MNIYVVSIEYSLVKPNPSLGDEQMCHFFNRVSNRCPLLHLFGYVHTKRYEDRPSHSLHTIRTTSQLEEEGKEGKEEERLKTINDIQERSVCVHVHGIYPYFMVLQHDKRISAVQFGAQLETVAASVLGINNYNNNSNSNSVYTKDLPQLLHHVEVVKRVPFYGYHTRPLRLFKVSVINPAIVGKLIHLLCSTTHVGGRQWELYDAHSPFHFQFMVDYGVKGMAPFSIPSCTVRAPLPAEMEITQSQLLSQFGIIAVMPLGEPPRLTRAEVEIDVSAQMLQRRDGPMEPGENLLSVRRNVQKYFAEFGVDDAIRRSAALTDISTVRHYSVSDLQQGDPSVVAMRQQALMYLRARGTVVRSDRNNVNDIIIATGTTSDGTTPSQGPLLDLLFSTQDETEKGNNNNNKNNNNNNKNVNSNSPSTTPLTVTPSVGLTLNIMQGFQAGGAKITPLSFSSSSSSSSSSSELSNTPCCDGEEMAAVAMAQRHESSPSSLLQSAKEKEKQEKEEENYNDIDENKEESECLLLSSGSGSHISEICIHDKTFAVGDSVLFFNVQLERETTTTTTKTITTTSRGIGITVPFCAKITAVNSHTVRLRWYLTLRETHLADTQSELERRGRWYVRRKTHKKKEEERSGTSSLTKVEEELLLGDVEDDNSIDVLRNAIRVVVVHNYCDCKNHVVLCRYKYHISEQRLSMMEPNMNGDVVALPLDLISSVSDNVIPGVVDEGEELLLSSSSSSSSSSVLSSVLSLSTSLSTSFKKKGNTTPIVLQRSVKSVIQQVAQSQLSLLLTGTSVSPYACTPVVTIGKVNRNIKNSENSTSSSSSSSSVKCINPHQRNLLLEWKEQNCRVQPSYFTGDIPRNFQWVYNEDRQSVVVSAASWPFSTPLSSSFSSFSSSVKTTGEKEKEKEKEKGEKVIIRSDIEIPGSHTSTTRSSIPLLSQVAHRMITPLPHRRVQNPKQKWNPHTSSNISNSVQGNVHMTCSFRVMCVEVLIRRERDVQHVAQEELLAVALGKTTSTDNTIGVQLFCVSETLSVVSELLPFSGNVNIVYVSSEAQLLRCIRRELIQYDPDVILSWDGFRYGIGLLAMRYHIVLQRSLARDLSRLVVDDVKIKSDNNNNNNNNNRRNRELSSFSSSSSLVSSPVSSCDSSCLDGIEGDCGNTTTTNKNNMNMNMNTTGEMVKRVTRRFGSSLRITGRIIIDLSKQLRKELQLPSYSLQMVHQKLFNRNLPYFTDIALSEMYLHDTTAMRRVALSVLLTRTITPHRIAHHLNFYTRTAEFSRMYGILFNEVISRGSQYRVEATLHRMAKPIGYTMLSPSREYVHRQPRLQSMPLILQPRSDFYKDDPIVVLDFRSLYPSIIIAYNLCYSTCLGTVRKCRYSRLGVVPSYKQADALILSRLKEDEMCREVAQNHITFAPNGCMFLTPATREGVLPQMLRALIETRLEVQAALKYVAQPCEDTYMQQVLHEQQAAIKLLANTTYGYTAASFTGRMPCVDLADAIVMFGRQTLERAIRLINGHPTWNAEVVYGDTDSLFVRLPGRTKEEAFVLGEQMAKEVTMINPSPIQLQFEKVLFPCLLLVKKRYVGYAYFKPDQKEPQFLAKGIETVRRDQCLATSRLASCMIHALFSGASTETLRNIFYEEVSKLQRGSCNPADCIFRKAVKLGSYRLKSNLPLVAHLAMQLMKKDITYTPYWGERVPYLVVQSMESVQLRDRVVHPQSLLNIEENLKIDTEYYIKRHIIPVLDRFFYLIGVSCASWYAAMPKRRTYRNYFELGLTEKCLGGKKRTRISDNPLIVDVDKEEEEDEEEKNNDNNETHLHLKVNYTSCNVKKRTLDEYYQQTLCAVCLESSAITNPPDPPICTDCIHNRTRTVLRVITRRRCVEGRLRLIETTCLRCIGSCGEIGGLNSLSSNELEDMEDIHFAIPRSLVNVTTSVHSTIDKTYNKKDDNKEEYIPEGCVSIDCHLSFEKRQLFLLYLQLMVLEQYVTDL